MKNLQLRAWIGHPHECMYNSEFGDINILFEWVRKYGGELLLYSGYLDDKGLKIWEGDLLKITDEHNKSPDCRC